MTDTGKCKTHLECINWGELGHEEDGKISGSPNGKDLEQEERNLHCVG